MGQTNLEVSWEEAKTQDKLNSRFFQPESNTKYKMTFTSKEAQDPDSPDGKCVNGRLIRKAVPVWENGKKTDRFEDKVVLQLVIDSLDMKGIDGTFETPKPCEKIWNIKNAKMRNLFRTYQENGLLDKKVFVVEIEGEMLKQNYRVTALDKSPK